MGVNVDLHAEEMEDALGAETKMGSRTAMGTWRTVGLNILYN